MTSRQFDELVCSGTYLEMGATQGAWLRPRIDKLFHTLVYNPLTPRWVRWLGPDILRALLAIKGIVVYERNLETIDQAAELQVDRMRGIASGAGISLYGLLGIGSIETMAAHMQFVLGCSSIVIGAARTTVKRPLLGYNHDFPAFLRDHLFIRRSRPRNRLASVQLTYPAIPGCICGVNEAGVGVSLNHAFTTEPFNRGVPPTFMAQEALDHCRTADDVIDLFSNVSFSCGSILSVLDEKGEAFALELSRERFGVRTGLGELCLSLNDYQIPYLKEIEVPQDAKFHPRKYPEVFHGVHVHQHNWERRRQFREMLEKQKKFSRSDIKELLADHAGHKKGSIGTICRHHGTVDTIATAVIDPVKRTLEAGRGHACKAAYRSYPV